MDISVNSKVCQLQNIVASEIDDEVVMMSIETGAYYGIDEIGSRIWKLIETPCRVSDLIDKLMNEFEVDYETCQKDVLLFLQDLQEKKTIQVQSE